jgi:hypothetical protein
MRAANLTFDALIAKLAIACLEVTHRSSVSTSAETNEGV